MQAFSEEAIFDIARRIDSADARRLYLRQACGDNDSLRDRVEALLRVHDEEPGFLNSPIGALPAFMIDGPPVDVPGTVIGPYKLLEQIGEGAFGVVFMAEQQAPIRRKVALKILKAGMDTRQVIARFEAERQALALMDHPHIAKFLDAGQTPLGRPYFVMDLVKGLPITEYCDSAQLTPRERLELFVDVCQGVQHAHQKGIIHRDIKPSNVMVTLQDSEPLVKIIDFGVAKALGQQLTDKTLFTGFAQMVGTPLYMAPEQAALSNVDIDTRSDIYSLGVLMYELLTGTTPFDKERLTRAGYDELRRIIREDDPPKPSTRVSTLGATATEVSARRQSDPKRLCQLIRGELDWIVIKAMDKERGRRYETAGTLVADVQRYLQGGVVSACPPSALYRFSKLARRHKTGLFAAVLISIVLSAGTAISVWQAIRATAAMNAESRALVDLGKEQKATRRELFESLVAQARASRLSRRSGQRFRSLEALAQAARIARDLDNLDALRNELRTEASAALCVADLEMDRELGSEIVGADGFTIDPAFQRYAVADKDGEVSIRRLLDDRELLQLPGGGAVGTYGDLQFSPDGRFFHQRCRVASGFRSRLWDLDRPKPNAVLDDEHSGFGFAPDGRQCALAYQRDRTIRVLETASARELKRFRVDLDLSDCLLLWNPALPQLLLGSSRGLWLLNLDTAKVARVGPDLLDAYNWCDWHPEGRILAVSGSKNNQLQIHLWDVQAGRSLLPALLGHQSYGVMVKFDHAGDRLLSTDWAGSGKLWDTRSGQLLLSLALSNVPPYFSPDDRLVGTGHRGKALLYRFRRGEALRTLVNYGRSSQLAFEHINACLDPAGRACAVWSYGGIAIVDLARGEVAGLLAVPNADGPIGFDLEGSLWTGGPSGLLRWPARAAPATVERHYGPPERIWPQVLSGWHGSSADLRIVALASPGNFDGARLFHRESRRLFALGAQEDVRYCAVSPDGRYIATGSHSLREGAGVKVWNARDRRLIKDLPVDGCCAVRFSPNGRWLLTTAGGPRLWAVGTWEEGPKLGGTPSNSTGAFSGDDNLLALGDEPGVVRLVVTDSGAELARLTAPEPVRLKPCCFTTDGTKLLTVGVETGAICVFDLAAIRTGLAELALDWDAPPFSTESKAVPPRLSVQFDMADSGNWAQADSLVSQAGRETSGKEHAKALATLRQAVKIAPSLALAHNNLAWLLLTGPEELRDPAQALPEAKKAVELDRDEALYHNTLGVALYRVGQFAEAVKVLEESLRRGRGQSDAFDLFFLAMCHHRLGDSGKAKECRQRGATWFENNKSKLIKESPAWFAELIQFQAEADAVLAEPPAEAKRSS